MEGNLFDEMQERYEKKQLYNREEVLSLILQIGKALKYLQQLNIAH